MDYENNVKRVIPMIMLVFISSATMISVINIISPQLSGFWNQPYHGKSSQHDGHADDGGCIGCLLHPVGLPEHPQADVIWGVPDGCGGSYGISGSGKEFLHAVGSVRPDDYGRDLRFRADDYPGEQVHRGAGACQILWVQYCLRVHFTGIRYPAGRFFCNVHRVEVCVPDSAGLTGSPSVHMQVCAG